MRFVASVLPSTCFWASDALHEQRISLLVTALLIRPAHPVILARTVFLQLRVDIATETTISLVTEINRQEKLLVSLSINTKP